jgi:hypothetical protein
VWSGCESQGDEGDPCSKSCACAGCSRKCWLVIEHSLAHEGERNAIPFAFQVFRIVASCILYRRFCRLDIIAQDYTGSGRIRTQLATLVHSAPIVQTQQIALKKQCHDVGQYGKPGFRRDSMMVLLKTITLDVRRTIVGKACPGYGR